MANISYGVYISLRGGTYRYYYAFLPVDAPGPRISWALAANQVGKARITFWRDKFTLFGLAPDGMVEIWRSVDDNPARHLMTGFIRDWRFVLDGDGLETIELDVYEATELLTRRIVGYASGTAQAKISGPADDLMKELVRDNLGTDAVAARNITSAGGLAFSVAPNTADAPTINAEVSWRNLLEVVQELADASREAGTKLFFQVVNTQPSLAFEFVTSIDRIGQDRTWNNAGGSLFSAEMNNLTTASLAYVYSDEVSYVYAGGQGEGSDRSVVEVSDSDRINRTYWNRREAFIGAGGAADTDEATSIARRRLREGRPRLDFDCEIIDNDRIRFGVEWFWGDEVSVTYQGNIYNGLINKVWATYQLGEESLQARIDFDDVII